VLDIV